jgi:predicted esterase
VRRVIAWCVGSVLGFAAAGGAGAQAPVRLADVRPGEAAERVRSASDTAQEYAVYLPPGYTPERAWPVLFAMDPRGRAMVPMRLFRLAAGRLGWIVLSSYNTASDVSVDPNAPAVAAMLADAQRELRIDPSRLYLAGFSGTARAAWSIALGMPDHVAGIIGFGAGLPGEAPFLMIRGGIRFGFAYFGGAGNEDFNYDEVRTLDRRLDGTGLEHRFAAYAGPHSWPPAEVCSEAIEWMELLAVKRGLARHPDAWVDSLLAVTAARAEEREAAGDRVGALSRWRAAAADFAGLRDVSRARARADALARDREVRRALDRSARQARRDSAESARHDRIFADAERVRRFPSAETLSRELDIAALKVRAARTDDTIAALSARRLLQGVLAYAAFYGPRRYMEREQPERALALLAVAREIDGDGPQVCLAAARAHARMGHADEAFAALACVEKAHPGAALLERDPGLAPLRGDPRFAELLARLRTAPASPPR